jgi:hypothetical protein
LARTAAAAACRRARVRRALGSGGAPRLARDEWAAAAAHRREGRVRLAAEDHRRPRPRGGHRQQAGAGADVQHTGTATVPADGALDGCDVPSRRTG